MPQPTTAELAVLLVCSGLATRRGGAAKPLGPNGWASLRSRANDAAIDPGKLIGMRADQIEGELRIAPDRATQLGELLERQVQLAFELERLERLGIWFMTIESEGYPARLRERLGTGAPPVLFGLGERSLLDMHGLAVVGSRDAPQGAMDIAREAGQQAARQGWAIVSGAARGVDGEAMRSAAASGGVVIGVTADGLERHLKDASLRAALADGTAAYLSPYQPAAPFTVGGAMGRNKLIYCLAGAALVAHTSAGRGGTWSGAVEALKAGWVPVYVPGEVEHEGAEGLIAMGARQLLWDDLADLEALAATEATTVHKQRNPDRPIQETLF